MGRISNLFEQKKEDVLNVYITAGYPERDDTLPLMQCLQKNGVDILEIGMPYSDPLADGPVIQASSARALSNGMSIPVLLKQLQDMRPAIQIPVILMGYLNPLLQYGFEKFCREAAAIGVDGLIIPDIPLYEFEKEYKTILNQCGLDFIFLVTPDTDEERIKKIDQVGSGFIYAVSSTSVTGSEKDFTTVENYLSSLKELKLKNPVLVGFGIRDRESFETVCRHAQGAIIGSAFIKALGSGKSLEETTASFIQSIRPGKITDQVDTL